MTVLKILRDSANKESITRLQIILFMTMLVVFIILSTNIIKLSDIWKIIIYIAFNLAIVIAGNPQSFKKLATELKDVWLNDKLTNEQKIKQFGNIAIKALMRVGEAWEEINTEQGTAPKEAPKIIVSYGTTAPIYTDVANATTEVKKE